MAEQLRTLRINAALESAEAQADLLEDTVRGDIARLVGTRGPNFSLDVEGGCNRIDVGDFPGAEQIEQFMRAVCFQLTQTIEGVSVLMGDVVQNMTAFFDQVMRRILGDLETAFSAVLGRLGSILDDMERAFESLSVKLVAQISSITQQLVSTVADMTRQLVDQIDDIVGRVVEGVERLIEEITFVVDDLFASIGIEVGRILSGVQEGFSRLLDAAGAVAGEIAERVSALAEGVIGAAEDVVGQIGESISGLVGALTDAASGALERVTSAVGDVAGAVREVAGELVEGLVEGVGGPIAAVGQNVIEATRAYFHGVLEEADATVEDTVAAILQKFGVPPEGVERVRTAIQGATPEGQIVVTAVLVSVLPFIIAATVTPAIAPVAQQVQQEVNQIVRPTLLPPAEAFAAEMRGEISERERNEELTQAGFSDRRIEVLTRLRRLLVPVGELVSWWLRGFITDEDLGEFLAWQGWDPEDQQRIKANAFFIPPVQDLIRMAVREVFTPEIREQFALDEGFPEPFAEDAAKQGVSEEWARNYWAAHWELPSITQGFRMLHRGVISQQDLETLLRAKDVMPFWREKLIDISFSPLTRVDVRRMHKLGLIPDEELVRRYMDLGFDETNAGFMRDFTIEYNKGATVEQPGELEGLTRATLLGMYEDGVFEREQTRAALIGLGYSEAAADLLLVQRDLEIERAERREAIDSVLERARTGVLTFDQAQDELSQLGLEAAEQSKAMNELLRQQQQRTRLPTVEQLGKMLAEDLLSEDQYIESLGFLGFSRFWAEKILVISGGGEG